MWYAELNAKLLLLPKLLPVSYWCHSEFFFEQAYKSALVLKAALGNDVAYGGI